MISKRLRRWPGSLLLATLFLWCSPTTGGPRQISNDRDLKELDLTGWNCLNRPEGSARTPDGMERNRLKNRLPVDLSGLRLEDLNVQTFLNATARFDALTKNKRRKDLVSAERALLDPLEKQIVRMTGYLVLAYCGPPETTNCASVDFHDWHLEVFEKPSDHPPQPGDPTSIICEITPRTQNQLYREGIRIQALTAFFRGPDLTYQATGHKAARIRVTGYRLWDDEHNGRADVGPTVRSVGANKYHNPWRLSAWEIHPVIQIEALDRCPGRAGAVTGPNRRAPAQRFFDAFSLAPNQFQPGSERHSREAVRYRGPAGLDTNPVWADDLAAGNKAARRFARYPDGYDRIYGRHLCDPDWLNRLLTMALL